MVERGSGDPLALLWGCYRGEEVGWAGLRGEGGLLL